MIDIGEKIFNLCRELFPINRSLTGNGNRKTFSIIKKQIPELNILEIPSGTKVFDWEIPKEWNVNDAYILDPNGNKICDFKKNNLHLLGYSIPIKTKVPLDKLEEHLYSLPEQPNAIPYVTSYYKERWGFCISHEEREKLIKGEYTVVIDSKLTKGSLTIGELVIKGTSSEEILLSSYICHPSLANNELSGPTVLTYIVKWLLSLKNRNYTYRIIFIPETIGSITYICKNLKKLKESVVAGYNLTCIGDNLTYSFLETRKRNTLSDRIALHVLSYLYPDYKLYSYLERGSDERQYNSPGVDLPIASLMRSKYGEYPEYHTSLDDLNFISVKGLAGGYDLVKKCIQALESNVYPIVTVLCEPLLSKRNLYSSLSKKGGNQEVRMLMNVFSYCDGNNSVLEIANIIGQPIWEVNRIIEILEINNLIKIKRSKSSLMI